MKILSSIKTTFMGLPNFFSKVAKSANLFLRSTDFMKVIEMCVAVHRNHTGQKWSLTLRISSVTADLVTLLAHA